MEIGAAIFFTDYSISPSELAIALELSPDSWEVNKEAARLFYRQRRLDDAARHLEKATQVMEADYHGLGMLFAYYNGQGDAEGMKRTARARVRVLALP